MNSAESKASYCSYPEFSTRNMFCAISDGGSRSRHTSSIGDCVATFEEGQVSVIRFSYRIPGLRLARQVISAATSFPIHDFPNITGLGVTGIDMHGAWRAWMAYKVCAR